MGPALASSSVTEIITELSTSEMFSGHREKYLTLMVLFRTILTFEICEIRYHFIHGKGFGFCFFFSFVEWVREERRRGIVEQLIKQRWPTSHTCVYAHTCIWDKKGENELWLKKRISFIWKLNTDSWIVHIICVRCESWAEENTCLIC